MRTAIFIGLILAGFPSGIEAGEDLDLKAIFRDGTPKSPFIAPLYALGDALVEAGGLGAAVTDGDLLRLLFFLRDITGKEGYSQAAGDRLRNILEVGGAAAKRPGPIGGLSGPWLLWEKCFDLSPEASRRAAIALAAPAAGGETPRQAGFRLRALAEAHAATGDPTFIQAIETCLRGLEESGAAGPSGLRPGVASPADILSLAIDLDGAARMAPGSLRTRLALLAVGIDAWFCSLPHFSGDRKGFAVGPSPTPLWLPAGGDTTARVAAMCVSRYENLGGPRYRDLFIRAADSYVGSLPEEGSDAWPSAFGHAISLELAAFRATAGEAYFAEARRLGNAALERFFAGRTLPRRSLRSERYEEGTGAGVLALALADLHLTTLAITAVRAPANTADR